MPSQHVLLYENQLWEPEIVLTASSQVATLPATFLGDQLRQKPWRTAIGWTIVAGFNNKLDFNRGGVKVATITAGTYTSAQTIAEAVRAALAAADGGVTWEVTYTAGHKFRIRDAAGAPLNFNLLWATGANVATSIGLDLGFEVSDDTGTFDYTADDDSYQGRHYLKINRSDAATFDAQAIALLEHNLLALSSNQAVKIQGNATDSWTAPTFSQTLSATDDPRVEFFSVVKTFAWWRFVVEDVSNPAGYFELGILFLGEYDRPSINTTDDLADEGEDFSSVETGLVGTHFVDRQRSRARWSIEFSTMESIDRAIFEHLIDVRGVGQNFFLVWDFNSPSGSSSPGTDGATYGFMAARPKKQHVPNAYWTYTFPFFEAL